MNSYSALQRTTAPAKAIAVGNDNFEILSHEHVEWHNLDHQIDPVSFLERMFSDAQIKKQSEVIAHKLANSGFDPYLSTEDRVSMVGLVSGAVLNLSKYRNLNIIPEVAQRNRRALINEFKLFLKENPKVRKYARYLVVTSGKRFAIDEFSGRLKLFNDSLGRYFERCKEKGIRPILCSIEFTVDDNRTINLHANIVTSPEKAFGKNGWIEWLEETREHFDGNMLHDAGRIKDVNEIIKYVCKYNGIAALDGIDTAHIAQALYKKQLVRPLGIFQKWRSKLKKDGQKIRFDRVRDSLVRCQVAKRKKPAGERYTLEELQEAALEDADKEAAAERRKMAARAGKLHDREPIENQVLMKTLPQTRATLLAEPFIVVVNFNGAPTTTNGREGLEAIEARRRHHFKLMAEFGIEADDLKMAGASRLDTLTIIPTVVSKEYFKLSPKRHKKLQQILGLFDLRPDLTSHHHVASAVKDALDAHYPQTFHEWGIDVADPVKLLAEGLERQEDYIDRARLHEAASEAYPEMKALFDSVDYDELEDYAIPY